MAHEPIFWFQFLQVSSLSLFYECALPRPVAPLSMVASCVGGGVLSWTQASSCFAFFFRSFCASLFLYFSSGERVVFPCRRPASS